MSLTAFNTDVRFVQLTASFLCMCYILKAQGQYHLPPQYFPNVTQTVSVFVSINKKHLDSDSNLLSSLLTTAGLRGFPQHEDLWLNFPYLPAQLCALSCVWPLFWLNQRDRRTGCLEVFLHILTTVCFPICTTNGDIGPIKRTRVNVTQAQLWKTGHGDLFISLPLSSLWVWAIKIQYSISHLISGALMDVSWSSGREPQLLPAGGPSWHQEQPWGAQGKVTLQNGAGCPETRAVSRSNLIHKSLWSENGAWQIKKKKEKKKTPWRQQSLFWCQLGLQCSAVYHSSITESQWDWLPQKNLEKPFLKRVYFQHLALHVRIESNFAVKLIYSSSSFDRRKASSEAFIY